MGWLVLGLCLMAITVTMRRVEAGEGPVEVSILLNDFVINTGGAPLRLELELTGDGEAINANSLNAVRLRQVSGGALGTDYMFISGWGATVRGEGTTVRWSGGRESVIGFFTARARPLRLVLRLSPIQPGSRIRGSQVVRIFCNGVELPEPIYLPRSRRVDVELPESYVRAGLNYLRLHYHLLENEYGRLERQGVALLRPRAVALNLLRFRQEGSD